MNAVKIYTDRAEAIVERVGAPLKPWLPAIARFLLVVTFLEDSIRIITQWNDQLWYIEKYRHIPWGLSHVFLITNVIAMLVGSMMAIARKRTEIAVCVLSSVIVTQAIGYGLWRDFSFFVRSLSVAGGLLMLLAEAFAKSRRSFFPGLPDINESDKATYLQLAGRILLVFLFVSFVLAGEFSWWRVIASLVGLVACVMVAVGFKAKWSATFLIMFLSVFNFAINNWWSLHHTHPHRDFQKYDFFQTLSIMGGFLLLVNIGPGGISVDEKKKAY